MTSLKVGAHPPNCAVMVQRNTDENPMDSPVTPDVGLVGEVTTADPETTDQVPVSLSFVVLPTNVVEVTPHRFCSGPASAIVVIESTLMVTSLGVGAQPPNPEDMVHLSTVV